MGKERKDKRKRNRKQREKETFCSARTGKMSQKAESRRRNERTERVRDRNREKKSYSGNDVVAMETLSSVRLLHRCLVGLFKGLQPIAAVLWNRRLLTG